MVRREAPGLRIARGILLATGALAAGGAAAQTRSFYVLNVQSEVEHDSNPTMAIGDSPGTTWLRVVPNLTTGYRYGAEEFALEAALVAEKSSNPDVAQDRLDPRLRGVWKHADDVNTAQVAVLAERRALRALDVRNFVPIGVDGARTLYSLGGSWIRELDARSRAGIELRQDWERYSDVSTPDFQLTVGAVRYTWQQDERRSWFATANGQYYRSEQQPGLSAGSDMSNTAVGATLGVSQSFTEAFRMEASAGPMHFNRPSKDSWQGTLTAEYTAQRWTAGLDLARTPAVNSTLGGLVVSDDARLRLRYELGPATRLEIAAAHGRQSDPDSKRTFASAAWVHQWAPAWQIALRAGVNRQEEAAGTARSNRIALVLTYSATDL